MHGKPHKYRHVGTQTVHSYTNVHIHADTHWCTPHAHTSTYSAHSPTYGLKSLIQLPQVSALLGVGAQFDHQQHLLCSPNMGTRLRAGWGLGPQRLPGSGARNAVGSWAGPEPTLPASPCPGLTPVASANGCPSWAPAPCSCPCTHPACLRGLEPDPSLVLGLRPPGSLLALGPPGHYVSLPPALAPQNGAAPHRALLAQLRAPLSHLGTILPSALGGFQVHGRH